MFFAKSNLMKCFIIIYLCTFLTGVPFVASSLAKITIKDQSKQLQVITIKKGDTLWALAAKYLADPFKWKEFKEHNIYTNPDLIYPGEEMQIPLPLAEEMLKDTERGVQVDIIKLEGLEEMREEIDAKLKELEEVIAQLKANSANSATKGDLQKVLTQMEDLQQKLSALTGQPVVSAFDLERTSAAITTKIEKSDEKVTNIEKRMDALEQLLKDDEGNLGQMRDKLSEIDKNIQALKMGIDNNQMAITKLESLLKASQKGAEVEVKTESKRSKNKRAFAFITAALSAVAWFAVNSYSHPD